MFSVLNKHRCLYYSRGDRLERFKHGTYITKLTVERRVVYYSSRHYVNSRIAVNQVANNQFPRATPAELNQSAMRRNASVRVVNYLTRSRLHKSSIVRCVAI